MPLQFGKKPPVAEPELPEPFDAATVLMISTVVIGLALLGCYCFGVLVWTGSLLVDQAGLIARNETSIERVKKTWRGRKNPHDRGAFRNWLDFCFRATPSVVLELDQVESRCEA